MNVQQEKTASVLSRAIQTVLSRGLNDPRVRGMMTVTGIKVTDDHSSATVMISVFPADQAELTVHGLQHAAQHIRTEVGSAVRIRRMPHLTFKIDSALKRESGVIAAINDAMREDEKRRVQREAAGTIETNDMNGKAQP